MDNVKISVVIPTRSRPALVIRALKSVLAQTLKPLEIIVVIDGPDEATLKALKSIKNEKLKIMALPENLGKADARNVGIKAASGEWIAFLDDDDEWLPEKLEKQIRAADKLPCPFPILASSIIGRTPKMDMVWPNRRPRPGEPVSEYLFVRNSLFKQDAGLLLTTTLMTKKSLLDEITFRNLKKHEDLDWILRAARLKGVCFEIVLEPLAVWYIEDQRASASRQYMWRHSLEWIRANQGLFTPRAYVGFISTSLAPQALGQGQWQAFPALFKEMFRYGAPRAMDLLLFMGMWLLPQHIRRAVRSLFKGRGIFKKSRKRESWMENV